jgi:MATE family multidrug resistance protein
VLLTIASLTLSLLKKPINEFFSSDQDILPLTLNVTWVLAFSMLPEGFSGMQKGVIRALGIQNQAMYITLFGYWIVNFACQYFLTFKLNMNMLGMWASYAIVNFFLFVGYSIILYIHNWQTSIDQARERVNQSINASYDITSEMIDGKS